MHVSNKQLCALDSLNQCSSPPWPKYTLLIDKALRLKTPDGDNFPLTSMIDNYKTKTTGMKKKPAVCIRYFLPFINK